jgi:mRNA interferase MazF
MKIKRGEIYLTRLAQNDPGITRTRPVLVVSNNICNAHSGTVTVLPITAKNLDDVFPFEVLLPQGIGTMSKESKVKTDQIRTIHRSNLIKSLGRVEDKVMQAVEAALKVHLGVDTAVQAGPPGHP